MRGPWLLVIGGIAIVATATWAQTNPPGKQPPPAEVKPPPKPDGAIHFEPVQLHLRLEQGRWFLRDGTNSIKDFGADYTAARTALQIIQQQHLTDLVWVGKPNPKLEFFLRDDQAPRAVHALGVTPLVFQPADLRVTQ